MSVCWLVDRSVCHNFLNYYTSYAPIKVLVSIDCWSVYMVLRFWQLSTEMERMTRVFGQVLYLTENGYVTSLRIGQYHQIKRAYQGTTVGRLLTVRFKIRFRCGNISITLPSSSKIILRKKTSTHLLILVSAGLAHIRISCVPPWACQRGAGACAPAC